MMDRSPEGIGLPPELADLDAELSSIRYEERPSFGPELEAELLRAHREAGPPARRPKRQLMAAGIAGILMAGMSVPSARASLARFVERLQEPEAERGAPSAPPASRMLPALELTPPSPVVGVEPPSARPGTSFPVPDTPRPGRNDVPEVTFPELVDRGATEELIRRHYPIELQEAGVGGTVRLRLWVDSTGSVEAADLGHSSGVPALDRVALEVAPSFEFEPARRRGRAVGTPVEFDVRFAPRPAPGPPLPEIPEAPEQAGVPDLDQRTLAPVWRPPVVPSPEGAREAGDRLRAAIGDEALVRRLGSIDAILAGDPPPGAPPTRWRAEVSEALEAAMLRDPDNAAPLLALARIRRKQGLKTEARVLFERGLQKALRGGAGSPAILAELHYERALLVRESWLAARGNGRVRAEALTAATCPQARSSGGVASGYASAERLIAWNYLCPIELARVFASSFEADRRGSEADRKVMMASLDAAVEASPGH
ncbi:MAG TPA: energy transducer TonB, partial [Longimicrobiales bacterium]|nr:energy transducer TonB [Longimicrobiales bacterium]